MELAVSETRLGMRRIFTGTIRDITEFKRAVEERLRLLKELEGERALLNCLLDNAPVGFGFFDHELRYLRLNPRSPKSTACRSRTISAAPSPRSCQIFRPKSPSPLNMCLNQDRAS